MKFTDFKQIDKIEFLYPELMSKDAAARMVKLHEQIQLSEDLLAEANKVADELRKKIVEYGKEWDTIAPLCKITYKQIEKEEVKGKINLGFNFGTEINKHLH